ncbi:MAG: S26 family signal peptidase [Bacteroidales bacterium]|nr:S26 family signal peptidase [Bacteroidales bacterium]
MKNIIKKYGKRNTIRFSITLIVYILWVIWLDNYWFLFGIPVIVDLYLTKRVNWTPWKKREGKNHWAVEWLDALIFAVVAVTIINIFLFQNYKIPTGSMEKSLLIGDHLYVSKVAYGPRLPNTPLAIPFMQHTIPGTDSKSYLDWIQLPYKRLKGFGKIKHDDAVVFNFPAGDTVCRNKSLQSVSYYYLIRAEAENLRYLDKYANQPLKTDEDYYRLGREKLWSEQDILVRPVDRRDNYIKRCVGIPGDTLQIIHGQLYVNGKSQKEIPGLQYDYAVVTNGRRLNVKKLQQIGISAEDIQYGSGFIQIPLTQEMVNLLQKNKFVQKIEPLYREPDFYDNKMFPHDSRYQWNLDYYGPVYIPKKGETIAITLDNLPLYERIIDYYEQNDLKVKDSTIYINELPSTTYTFKMDYYWMMGDNRHRSLDSRYWGYVPEDHIVGKPRLIWLSLNRDKNFPVNIRIRRMFKIIR